MAPITVRAAWTGDHPTLLEMQARSMRQLGRDFYTPRQIEAFIARVGTMDRVLLEDGTYWVGLHEGQIVASGGWSLRQPGYARCDRTGSRERCAPKIRSIYVDPAFAGRGLGRLIMSRVEREILSLGYCEAELAATLSGATFYAGLGFTAARPVVLDLEPGLCFVGLAMSKLLQPRDWYLAA